jgi:Zn-dependent M28 family amino/carboxypeptidase
VPRPRYDPGDARRSSAPDRWLARRRGDDIRAMISLESIGYFATTTGSQKYPPLLSVLYPDTGHFIAVVGDLARAGDVRRVANLLRAHQTVPVESAAYPAQLPGISWSDHASFWDAGYPGVMITDTAPYRNPNYHRASDTPATLDYGRLAQVTAGVIATARTLARTATPRGARDAGRR